MNSLKSTHDCDPNRKWNAIKVPISTIIAVCLLCLFTMALPAADEDELGSSDDEGSVTRHPSQQNTFGSDPRDPSNFLQNIDHVKTERESLFGMRPLKRVHNIVDTAEEKLYEKTRIKMGLTFNNLVQGMTQSLPGTDRWGATTDADLVMVWELFHQKKPTQGTVYAHLEGRWDYGTTGPQDLGFVNLGSQIGTANAFSAYTPAILVRNLYWEQGSPEAGWAYRIGKITTDAILGTSKHITPVTTFLPNAGTGFFVNGYPDSGFGAVGAWYLNDRFKTVGLVSDANGNRYNWGDIGAGDFYTAIEVAGKIVPGTGKADFSKITFWHTDGTKDDAPSNAETGKEGWGYSLKYEQELTKDGRGIGILRWGQSFNEAALYHYQAGANFLYYDPRVIPRIKDDLVGVGLNWVEPTAANSRDEYNAEIFYRFPMFPRVDTTFSYQFVYHPALAPNIDHASVFSFRLRTVF